MKKKGSHDADNALWKEAMALNAIAPNKKLRARHKKVKHKPAPDRDPPLPAKEKPAKKKWVRVEIAPPVPARQAKPAQASAVLPIIDKTMLARIGEGKRSIDARLDLHGRSENAAHSLLLAFVEDAYADGARTLLVITGKGKDGSGALRRNLPRWLAAAPRIAPLLAAISPAALRHGGDGAFYVVLRKKF